VLAAPRFQLKAGKLVQKNQALARHVARLVKPNCPQTRAVNCAIANRYDSNVFLRRERIRDSASRTYSPLRRR
jgi:hypothetical protein